MRDEKRAFNSLFEMRSYRRVGVNTRGIATPFNSLFEMRRELGRNREALYA